VVIYDALGSEFQEWYNGLERNLQAKIAGVLSLLSM